MLCACSFVLVHVLLHPVERHLVSFPEFCTVFFCFSHFLQSMFQLKDEFCKEQILDPCQQRPTSLRKSELSYFECVPLCTRLTLYIWPGTWLLHVCTATLALLSKCSRNPDTYLCGWFKFPSIDFISQWIKAVVCPFRSSQLWCSRLAAAWAIDKHYSNELMQSVVKLNYDIGLEPRALVGCTNSAFLIVLQTAS